jgi:hypothetical protein
MATWRFMSVGRVDDGRRGDLLGEASWAACCRVLIKLSVAVPISSLDLSFGLSSTF